MEQLEPNDHPLMPAHRTWVCQCVLAKMPFGVHIALLLLKLPRNTERYVKIESSSVKMPEMTRNGIIVSGKVA